MRMRTQTWAGHRKRRSDEEGREGGREGGRERERVMLDGWTGRYRTLYICMYLHYKASWECVECIVEGLSICAYICVSVSVP